MKVISNTGPIIGLAKIGWESEQIDQALNDFIHVEELRPLRPEVGLLLIWMKEKNRPLVWRRLLREMPYYSSTTVLGEGLLRN